MKNIIFTIIVFLIVSFPVFSQTDQEPKALGLPGDNLDLYAVLDLFQKSKTIEDFQSALNSEKEAVNNLDLDNDKKIDFIKVVTKQEKDTNSFTFILQDPISKTETQDIAVILVSKDKDKKITIQIVGDELLYGKNYIVEPVVSKSTSSVTANPAYVGNNPVAATAPVVVVESSPVVVYLYSPVYVPYFPPYYYGFFPPYFHSWSPIYFSMYYHNVYHHHAYYQNTVIIHNSNNYAHYSNSYKNTSVTVNRYNKNGNYKSTYQGNNYNKPTTKPANASSFPSNTNKPQTTQTANRSSNASSVSNNNRAGAPQTTNRASNSSIQSAKSGTLGKRKR